MICELHERMVTNRRRKLPDQTHFETRRAA
jgi:hypothetical protein